MTRDDIIRMAREAGMLLGRFDVWDAESSDLERFFHMAYAAGAAAQLEACIQACDSVDLVGADECIEAIRARGQV